MKKRFASLLAILFSIASFSNFLMSCNDKDKSKEQTGISSPFKSPFKPGNTVKTRYEVPDGFHRVQTEPGSFEEYLQNLPLKPEGYLTHLYDGSEKNRKVSTSVIDMDIDPANLQQCADAIIRLRAEYLYKTRQFDKIHFNFTNGFRCDYIKWAQGYRIKTEGNHTSWYRKETAEDFSYPTFREYLLKVFEYAGTASLAGELQEISRSEMNVGTIIVQPGFPGHAVIVVDMIVSDDSLNLYRGEGVLLAQSYMPAQEIEILKGYDDELGMFSDTSDPDRFNKMWSPTRHKDENQGFFTAEYCFKNPKFMKFKK